MRGSECLKIETLYDLELQLMRYPGLKLESILTGSIIEYEEENGDVNSRFEPLNDDFLLFGFRGPEFGSKGRPRSVVIVAREGVDDENVRESALEDAVHSLESLIKNNSESRP